MDKEIITSNYEAIKNMTLEEMAAFIDDVYVTGLNDGMYTIKSAANNSNAILDNCPYDSKWLSDKAEDATLHIFSDDNDEYLPNALVQSISRLTGIDPKLTDISSDENV